MDTMDHSCTVYRTMDYLSKKWAILILHQLSKGDEWHRFNQIKTAMKDVTPKILTERLNELVQEGLVEKRVDTTVMPMKSEYRLTEMSRELMVVIHDLKMWALKWKIDNPACAKMNCTFCTL